MAQPGPPSHTRRFVVRCKVPSPSKCCLVYNLPTRSPSRLKSPGAGLREPDLLTFQERRQVAVACGPFLDGHGGRSSANSSQNCTETPLPCESQAMLRKVSRLTFTSSSSLTYPSCDQSRSNTRNRVHQHRRTLWHASSGWPGANSSRDRNPYRTAGGMHYRQ